MNEKRKIKYMLSKQLHHTINAAKKKKEKGGVTSGRSGSGTARARHVKAEADRKRFLIVLLIPVFGKNDIFT